MKSIDKLKRLTGESVSPKPENERPAVPPSSEKQFRIDDLRRRIDGVVARSTARARAAQDETRARGNRALCEILEGEERENRHGRFFLACLQEIAAQRKFLVTFNGKAFDVNLLATRFILNRMQSSLHELPHLDLLHPARRLLGHRLENCRLATLEADILGVEREGDIPGWEIPQRYFDWLRRRDPRLLADIFEHNRLDVISMATLTAHLVDLLNARALKQHAHPDDYLAAARLLLKKAGKASVEKILEILGKDACAGLSLASKKKLANLCKRTGRLDEAVRIWGQMMECNPSDFYAVSELAKHLEHRARDYARAKVLIEDALAGGNLFSEEEKDSLRRRLKRLTARIQS